MHTSLKLAFGSAGRAGAAVFFLAIERLYIDIGSMHTIPCHLFCLVIDSGICAFQGLELRELD